jgi:hypothetical protein
MDLVEFARATSLVLVAAIVGVEVVLRRRWSKWLQDTRGLFARHGMALSHSPKFRWVAIPTEPVDIEVRGKVYQSAPGADPERVQPKDSTHLRTALPGGGLLMVPPDAVEPLLGPMPPIPRVRTGHVRFDAAFATFAREGALPVWPNGESFPSAEDLDFLRAHGLRWLRWQDDTLEADFEPRQPADAVALVAFAQALRRRQKGRPAPTPEPHVPGLPGAPVGMDGAVMYLGVGIYAFVVAGLGPRFIGPLEDAVSRHVCGGPGIQLASDYARCPDGTMVSGASLLAGLWLGLAPMLAWVFLRGLSRLAQAPERAAPSEAVGFEEA